MRGTFANIRIKNHMVKDENGNIREGGYTVHYPSGETMFIYDAAMRYREEGVPLVVFAGVEYGNGSSRDWAAKGPLLLGVRAVIVESFERIHRSNLVGMGVLPLVFAQEGQNWQSRPEGRRNSRYSWSVRSEAAGQAHSRGENVGRSRTHAAAVPDRYSGRAGVLPARRHLALRCATWQQREKKRPAVQPALFHQRVKNTRNSPIRDWQSRSQELISSARNNRQVDMRSLVDRASVFDSARSRSRFYPTASAQDYRAVSTLELFTSQGCSSAQQQTLFCAAMRNGRTSWHCRSRSITGTISAGRTPSPAQSLQAGNERMRMPGAMADLYAAGRRERYDARRRQQEG